MSKKRKRRADPKPVSQEWDSGREFAFIAGYTEGGAPYGIRQDEIKHDTPRDAPEMSRDEGDTGSPEAECQPGLPVSLRAIVEALDVFDAEEYSYLNLDTGEIVTTTREERDLVEDEVDLTELPDWERERLSKISEALFSDRFVRLPDQFEIHEWSIMEDFSLRWPRPREREELLDAIHGRGAFRAFKSAIQRLGIADEWYQFRESALTRIARDWLEANRIPYRAPLRRGDRGIEPRG